MLNGVKSLLVGLPLLTQLLVAGGATSAVGATGLAISETRNCNTQPTVTTSYEQSVVIPIPVTANEDASLEKGQEKIVTAGKAGVQIIKHKVIKHCGRFVSDTPALPMTKSEAVATVKNVGTGYMQTEDSQIPYSQQQIADSSQYVGKTGIKSAGALGVKRTTYRYANTAGETQTKTYVSEAVVTPPVDEVNWYGTKEEPAAYPTKLSRTGICHAPGSTYYNRTLYYTAYNTLSECLNAGGRLPLR